MTTSFLNDQQLLPQHDEQSSQQRMVPLPSAPINASPVPHLTSLHTRPERGPYGDARYRGNCGGYLIRDLLSYFKPGRVLDPMTGSGTCRDVCEELSIPCTSLDIRSGQDACDPATYAELGTFDFAWVHPPYWRMIRYNDDPRCLSNAQSLGEFLRGMRALIKAIGSALSDDGKLAVLIGGYSERGMHMPLAPLTLQVAIEEGFWPACTEIIRFQHGNSSSKRVYRSSFIPGLHDTCMVLQRRAIQT